MSLVFHNEAFVVFNKKEGCPVFPFHAYPQKNALLYEVLEAFPSQGEHDWKSGFAAGIAHRLDVPTSGAVWVARTPQKLDFLRGLFEKKLLSKEYFFLTRKRVSWTHHVIRASIAHDKKKRSRMVVQRGRNTPHRGKWYPAETEFSLLLNFGELSLWRAKMSSGVMHQIRIHAAFAGIALAGDRLYGGGVALADSPVDFALHHCLMSGSGIPKVAAPLPDFWPLEAQKCVSGLGYL